MKNYSPLVVNFYAGPGAGKSSFALILAGYLKLNGVNAEYVDEYAKKCVWKDNLRTLDNQAYVFGKQLDAMVKLDAKVDVIVTDSPLLLSLLYDNTDTENFKGTVVEYHHKFNNLNIFVHRDSNRYLQAGRLQSPEEAKNLDMSLRYILKEQDTKIHYEFRYDLDQSIEKQIQKLITLVKNSLQEAR